MLNEKAVIPVLNDAKWSHATDISDQHGSSNCFNFFFNSDNNIGKVKKSTGSLRYNAHGSLSKERKECTRTVLTTHLER